MSDTVLDKNMVALDDMLASALPVQAPDDVIKAVTPWKRAMKLIFAGLILSFIGTEFYPLDFLVNLAGFLVMFFGFGRLRKENRAFMTCFVASICGSCLSLLRIIVVSFSVRFEIVRGSINSVSGIAIMVVMVFIMIAFTFALRLVEKKAGINISAGSAVSMLVWYLAVRAVVFLTGSRIASGHGRYLFPLFVLTGALVALFVHALYRLSKDLEEPGYAITTAGLRFSEKTIAIAVAALVIVLYCIGLAARNYKTLWTEPVYEDNSQLAQMSVAVESKGIPRELVEMLNEAELRELAASEIIPVDGPEAAMPDGSDEMIVRSYFVKNTDSCNELIYFEWRDDLQFFGTNGVSLVWMGGVEYSSDGEMKTDPDNIHGRIFCTDGGQTRSTEIFADPRAVSSASREEAGSDGRRLPSTWSYYRLPDAYAMSVFAGFSVPRGADHVRGYIYAGTEDKDRNVIIATFAKQTEGFRIIRASAKEILNTYHAQNDFAYVFMPDKNTFIKTEIEAFEVFRYRAVQIKQ